MSPSGPHSAGRRATRQRILEVSLELFQERGFRGTTMRDIARRAGIALGTTYNYFPTKEHLALYFFEQALERVMARFERERHGDMDLAEELFLLLSLELEAVAPYQEFLHLMVGQAASPDSRLNPMSVESQRLRARYLDFAGGLLQQARERGELPPLGPDAVVLDALWAFQLAMVLFWLNDASPEKEDTFALLDRVLRYGVDALAGEYDHGR